METKYTIDATGKTLGRIASQAATILRGKNRPDFERHIALGGQVVITNAGKLKTSVKKLKDNKYVWYSGYPGGKFEESMFDMKNRKGFKELVVRAVKGMIPNNKLKSIIMKKLTVQE